MIPVTLRKSQNLSTILRRYTVASTKQCNVKDTLALPASSRVITNGWIRFARKQKKVSFLQINDGSTFENLQVILTPEQTAGTTLSTGTCVEITGKVQAGLGAQSTEVEAEQIRIIGECDATFPAAKTKVTLEHLRQFEHLRQRSATYSTLFRFRNDIMMGIHNLLQEKGYLNITTPVLTTNDCEGGGAQFSVKSSLCDDEGKKKYFDTPAYLTVSGQLHLEAMSSGLGNVYTFSPAFRAENSNTRRHLAEFLMLELEIAFTRTIDDVIQPTFDIYKAAIDVCLSPKLRKDLEFLAKRMDVNIIERLEKLQKAELTKITYTDAVTYLNEKAKTDESLRTIDWGNDLETAHEKYLVKEYNNDMPLFVIDYPKSCKPFYMKASAQNPDVVHCFDFLVSGVAEVAGGSLREENLKILENNVERKNMNFNQLEWYRDLRKYGTFPHGGFGLGFDRLLQHLLGCHNIRDVVPFPRMRGMCEN